MTHSWFTTILIQPIYNVFIALIAYIPTHDAGIAIILLTLILRGVFLPTFARAMRTQHAMRSVEGDIAKINQEHKDDAVLRGQKTMELFKKHDIRPFSSILALLIQLPVFIALYAVFLREGFPKIATDLVYSFTPTPSEVSSVFLGFLDLTHSHLIVLALIVAGAQYLQSRISAGTMPSNLPPEKEQMMLMQRQMLLYFFPFMMGFITYTLPAAAGLYLLTNALVSIAQEFAIARKYRTKAAR
jgi:YidC/Oxa1 family membrane protein insertase